MGSDEVDPLSHQLSVVGLYLAQGPAHPLRRGGGPVLDHQKTDEQEPTLSSNGWLAGSQEIPNMPVIISGSSHCPFSHLPHSPSPHPGPLNLAHFLPPCAGAAYVRRQTQDADERAGGVVVKDGLSSRPENPAESHQPATLHA